MFVAIARIILGFTLACLSAAVVKVMFAVGPQDALAGDPARLQRLALLVAQFATVFAVFAGLFVLLAVMAAEWQGIHSVFFYVFVGMAIAATGFAAQYLGEAPSAATVFNNYGMTAYLTTGFVGGLVYWLLSGRYAGSDEDIYDPVRPPSAPSPLPVTPGRPPATGAAKTPAAPPAPAASTKA